LTSITQELLHKEPETVAETCQFDSEYIEKLNAITIKNESKLPLKDEVFITSFLQSFKTVKEETFEDVTLKTFYNMIYGDCPIDNGKTFLRSYIEKLENSDITEDMHDPDIPKYFKEESNKKLSDYTIEQLNNIFHDVRQCTYRLSYTHQLNQAFAPPQCQVEECYTSFFVSPSKVYILNRVNNSGFKFCDTFVPMTLTTLEQRISPVTKRFSVDMTMQVYVHFAKKVRLFKGKIESGAYSEMESNIEEVKNLII
jgi:hypothetical protein